MKNENDFKADEYILSKIKDSKRDLGEIEITIQKLRQIIDTTNSTDTRIILKDFLRRLKQEQDNEIEISKQLVNDYPYEIEEQDEEKLRTLKE